MQKQRQLLTENANKRVSLFLAPEWRLRSRTPLLNSFFPFKQEEAISLPAPTLPFPRIMVSHRNPD